MLNRTGKEEGIEPSFEKGERSEGEEEIETLAYLQGEAEGINIVRLSVER
jgi:hypothetical protein